MKCTGAEHLTADADVHVKEQDAAMNDMPKEEEEVTSSPANTYMQKQHNIQGSMPISASTLCLRDIFDEHILPIATKDKWSQSWKEFDRNHSKASSIPVKKQLLSEAIGHMYIHMLNVLNVMATASESAYTQ